MRMTRRSLIPAVLAASAALGPAAAEVAMAIEQPEYTVVRQDGAFELRRYAPYLVAETEVESEFMQAGNVAFGRLFRYISGANESKQKIAMTTPVFMENQDSGASVQMGFVMPKEIANEGVPKPTGEQVEVRTRSGGRFAVVRFSGQLSSKTAKEFEAKLRTWMDSKGLVAQEPENGGGVETAGYDPPFTPGPLRRNEVLIRIK